MSSQSRWHGSKPHCNQWNRCLSASAGFGLKSWVCWWENCLAGQFLQPGKPNNMASSDHLLLNPGTYLPGGQCGGAAVTPIVLAVCPVVDGVTPAICLEGLEKGVVDERVIQKYKVAPKSRDPWSSARPPCAPDETGPCSKMHSLTPSQGPPEGGARGAAALGWASSAQGNCARKREGKSTLLEGATD